MSSHWPVELREGEVLLRPLTRRDAKDYAEVRARNRAWLSPWEATDPRGGAPADFHHLRRLVNRQAKTGRLLPFVIDIGGRLRGQLTVSGFQWSSLMTAQLGYWIDERLAGRGHTPTAVALATDYCFTALGLHRMEINIRPENTASLRVVEKLGFRYEGRRERYMHINGAWADHVSFALLREDVPFGLLDYWKRNRAERQPGG